jgi:type VII secretion-associated serine protease mycosin
VRLGSPIGRVSIGSAVTGRLSRLAALVVLGPLLALLAPAAPADADAVRDAQWHLAFLDIAKAQRINQGDGVTVAVLDSGVDGNHPDLTGNVRQGVGLLPGHPANGWEDIDEHGSAMAGIIAGHGHANGAGVLGIAPKAKILPIQVVAGDHIGDEGVLATGIEAAVQRGVQVISISLGERSSVALQAAVEHAQRAGIVVVVAAGNKPIVSTVEWPARYDGVVVAGATDRDGNLADVSVTGPEVLISAPGVDIVSTGSRDRYWKSTGTSDSTAIVAGVVALIRSRFPKLSATEVIHRLTATATDKGPKGRDDQYGYGIVNPYAALTVDVPSASASPAADPSPSTSGVAEPPRATRAGSRVLVIALGTVVLVALIAFGVVLLRPRRT